MIGRLKEFLISGKTFSSKIFCIGLGKTGTTSVKKAWENLGIQVGDQAKAELLIHEYGKRNFKPIIDYCHSAEAFQDIPFCLPYTYQALDQAFPNSKFILTIRDDEHQWYRSLTTFHTKVFGKGERVPNKKDMQEARYRYKGYAWESFRIAHNTPEDDLYNEAWFKAYYLRHIENVTDYFRHKDNLLVINVGKKEAYKEFCDFIGKTPIGNDFPWENKTVDKAIKR